MKRSNKVTESRVVSYLALHPRATITEVAKALKLSISTVWDVWKRIKHEYDFIMIRTDNGMPVTPDSPSFEKLHRFLIKPFMKK